MRCDEVLWTAPCPLPLRGSSERTRPTPARTAPGYHVTETNTGHLLSLLHLILTTPLEVGGSIPTLQMKKLRCKEIK